MNTKNTSHRTKGFTLIELVVAMVIAAILAAIAIPAYSNYVRKARRVEAKTALLDLSSLEERFFSTQNAYSAAPSDLGFPAGSVFPVTVGSGYYQVRQSAFAAAVAPTATTAGTPATYSFTAVPVPGNDQTKDTLCATFIVTSAGAQTAANSAGTDNTATCWH
jgi:type IV pilus assembly protein PilE